MSLENSSRNETLRASGANVRSLARVITFMNDECGALSERFTALIARILSFSCMRDIVSAKKCLTSETFAAYLTSVRFLACVRTIVYLQSFGSFEFLAAKCTKISSFLVHRWFTVTPRSVLFQYRFVLKYFVTDVASIFRAIFYLEGSLLVRSRCRRIVMIKSIVIPEGARVVERTAASVTLLKLHEIVHRCVSDEGWFLGKCLTAYLADVLDDTMITLSVSLDVTDRDTHEYAITAGHCLRRVNLLHVSVQKKLMRISFVALEALEWTQNTVCYSEMRHEARDKVKFFTTNFATLLTTLVTEKKKKKTTN